MQTEKRCVEEMKNVWRRWKQTLDGVKDCVEEIKTVAGDKDCEEEIIDGDKDCAEEMNTGTRWTDRYADR